MEKVPNVEKALESADNTTEGENQKLELTAEQKKASEMIDDGLQQADNEFEKIDVVDVESGEKEKGKNKLKKMAAKVMLFITLMTSMGAFADKAEANEWGRAAGDAVERVFDPQGLTLRQRRQVDNTMFKNYLKGIKTYQNEGNNWNKDASNAQRINLNQRLREINSDSSLTYKEKQAAIERARRGEN